MSRLLKLLAAGAVVVAVLIPWFWHNPEKASGALCAAFAAQLGSRVRVKYELRNGNNGTVLEAEKEADYILGESEDMRLLDAAVDGMLVGETKESPFGGDAGFGEQNPDWVVQYERDIFNGAKLEVGMQLELQGSSATVVAFNDSVVTLDFNHPLAGLNVTIVATLISVEAPCEAAQVVVEPISQGDGTTFPKFGDSLKVHCIGSYADNGDVFYSSREKDEPYEFQLGSGKAIRGLEIGIQNISLGGSARLQIPADLAYGRQSRTVQVPVKRDVIFEVELLSIG